MKKSSLTLISLLALSGPVFGQLASHLVTDSSSGSGTHQFVQNGAPADLTLCTYELCKLDDRGYLKIENVAAGSVATIIAQASEPDAGNFLVFYPAGEEGNPDKRRILRNRYMVSLADGANLESIKSRCGMKSIKLVGKGSKFAVCEEASAGRVLEQLSNVLNDPQVTTVEPIFARKRVKRALPTDPFYEPNTSITSDGNYQWYLDNEGVNGGVPNVDINLEGRPIIPDDPEEPIPPFVPDIPNTGNGVHIAVVDDGVAIDHADLLVNATGPHFNVFADDANPATFDLTANHGTAVAALIAADSNNGEGISGVAPDATLSGVRLLPGDDGGDIFIDDFEESQALSFSTDLIHVSNNSWGPSDLTLDFSGPGLLALGALEEGVETGRVVGGDAKGVVYVWAGGNGGDIGDRSDYDGYANSRFTIAVGAVDDSGSIANFSEEGSNLVVAAPSSGGAQDILTAAFGLDVDDDDNIIRTTEYTTTFGGTSASAPLVSGVVALMLEANPDLNWREVQDILIRTAFKIDANDGDWIVNGAGLNFNHKYGAGLVDATEAVNLATERVGDPIGSVERQFLTRVFSGLPDDLPNDSGLVPDNDGSSLIVSYDMSVDSNGNPLDNLKVEHVELRTRIITDSRTDLEVVLISPNGTQSILQAVDADNTEQSINNWVFMSVRNWGEGSAGTWLIRVTDRITGNPARLNDATLVINGVVDPAAPVTEIPILTSASSTTVDQGAEFSYTIESEGAVSVTVGELPEGVTFDSTTNVISGVSIEAGLFPIPIILTDEAGENGNFTLTLVVRPTAVALGDAVGLSGIPAVFEGDAPWDFELVDTNSENGDLSAARSAAGLLDTQTSIFGFDNLGEGVLMFDWKSSSEEGADRLWFNRGGEVPHVWDAFISGSREWATAAVILPEASNDVRWIYSKDEIDAAGEDRGLVDNVEFIEMDKYIASLVDAGPIQGFVPEFDSRMIFYSKPATGASPVPGGVDPIALASPAIGNGQTASMSTWVEGPGVFNALVILYADPTDVFELLIDGVVIVSQSGTVEIGNELAFLDLSEAVSEGRHRIQLRFRKDFSEAAFGLVNGEPFEGILLDNLSFVPDASFAAFAAAAGGFDDGDGYSLRQEYAFGGDFNIADVPRYLPKIVVAGDSKFIEYGIDTSNPDLEYTAQQSSDLTNWVDAELAILDRMEEDVEVYRIPVTKDSGQPDLFFRVLVEDR